VNAEFLSLPPDGRAAGIARRLVRGRLENWRLDDLVESAVLLTSEVVTNAVVHTPSAPAVGLTREGAGVRVTVVDGSPVPPRRRRHSATAITGRGIQMLHDLADDWGWNPVGDGKAVWFVLTGGHDPWTGAGPGDDTRSDPPLPETASPLGRYAPADHSGGLARVELLGMPVRVLAASREHHDGLMREFRLLALAGPAAGHDVPARLVELTQALGVRFAAAGSRPDGDFDRAWEQGLDTVDLVYRVPPTVAEGARQLEAMMSEADGFCRSAQLITLARTPLMVRFARWYLGQFLDQIAGRPATRWDGPLDPD
jgi:hypothetical protein